MLSRRTVSLEHDSLLPLTLNASLAQEVIATCGIERNLECITQLLIPDCGAGLYVRNALQEVPQLLRHRLPSYAKEERRSQRNVDISDLLW